MNFIPDSITAQSPWGADADKPVSTATQTALDLKANLASPTFSGTPTLPTGTVAVTQTLGNNTTAIATTAFIQTALANFGGMTVSDTAPSVDVGAGDFWWDSANNQLYVYNGTTFDLIGPQNSGEGLTQMQSVDILGQDGSTNSVITTTLNDVIIAIASNSTAFDIDASNTVTGFTKINKGLNLVNTPSTGANLGITTSEHRLHGTATAAEKIATSVGKFLFVASNISSAVSTLIKFILF